MADPKRAISWPAIFGTEDIKPSYKKLLLEQLEKDLGIFYSSEEANVIFSETARVLEEALHQNRLPQLLYKIDLNETQATEAIQSAEPVNQLTQLIFLREASKVLTRIRYRMD